MGLGGLRSEGAQPTDREGAAIQVVLVTGA